jgi:hypothetical protein
VTLRQKLLELDGHELVCYCKPAPCHGDILIKLVEEIKKGENSARLTRYEQAGQAVSGQPVADSPGRTE